MNVDDYLCVCDEFSQWSVVIEIAIHSYYFFYEKLYYFGQRMCGFFWIYKTMYSVNRLHIHFVSMN